jgi:glycosyltransferase involved in cell wall biosynthesis
MSEQILFSIIIPAYNYAHTLARAVQSVMSQAGDDYELWVINDGSTDKTDELMQALQLQYKHKLHYLRQENGGLSAVRNKGIEKTSGKYLVFLDADDEMLPTALSAYRKALEDYGDAGMLVGGHISIEEDGEERVHAAADLSADNEVNFSGYLYKRFSLSNGAVAMNRKVFKHIRYDPALRHAEDLPVFALVLANFNCHSLDQPLARIYKHAGSMRKNAAWAVDAGLKNIDVLFEHPQLPQHLLKYRDLFYVRRCLSLFRTCYRAGDFEHARNYIKLAWKKSPLSVLRWRYLKRLPRVFISGNK